MDKYTVKLYARAYRDIEEIYKYISENIAEPLAAGNVVDNLEKAILDLGFLPERGSIRKNGIYANKNYRQIFVKNYVIIYKVIAERKEVHIVTVRYAPSSF